MKKERSFPFFAAPPDAARRAACEAYLTERHPSLFSGEIGKSILGRPIRYFRVGQGKANVLFVGTHHGMEWMTTLLLYRFIDDFMTARARRGDPHEEARSLFFVPMLNPDGVEIELHGAAAGGPLCERLLRMNGGSADFCKWQANARGIDLNHNYDAGFAAYRALAKQEGIAAGGPTRSPGPYPASEPEVASLCAFLCLLMPRLTLTLHTQGEEIFYHPVTPPVPRAKEIGEHLSDLSGYLLGSADGLAAYGGMSDYVAESLRLPAFTVECGSGVNPLPIGQTASVYVRLRPMLFAAADMYD